MKRSQQKAMFAKMRKQGLISSMTEHQLNQPNYGGIRTSTVKMLKDRSQFLEKVMPSVKRFKALQKDEQTASKEYATYGYTRLSKDEARHRKFLIKQEKKLDPEYQKYERCVKKVKKQEGYNPYAVCRASIYKKQRK